ncbi:MAG: D-Ala-D-Ala carboxypeptidase family metallohydrolase [Bacteroides sp.]|nr:D-Ala-D-Ala carboxypeptidase family metallohydrolase [Bacteroides sp.]
MQLSKNFKLEEFTRSETAAQKGIKNEPNPGQIEKICRLVVRVLQPLRDKHGSPLTITSGFRCPELNKAVSGVPTSQHTTGEAADVKCPDPRKLLADLLASGIFFDQAILYPTFLHISYRTENNRKQVLYAKGVKP